MDPLNRLKRRLSKRSFPRAYEHSAHSYEDDESDTATMIEIEQDSGFLRLPANVRELIYGHVLGGTQIRVCDTRNCTRRHKCRSRGRKLHFATYFHLRRRRLALLTTCRQIHAETRLLPFALNEFHGYHWDMQLAVYYRLTDAQVGAMTNLRVYFECNDVIYYPALGRRSPSVNLGKDALATLRVLGHLRGLRKLTVEWVGPHDWEHDWDMVEGRMAYLIEEELEQIRGSCDIKVVVVGCDYVEDLDTGPVPAVGDMPKLVSFSV
ncbi:hypothetical protein COCCADRAFT_1695 [Bipolaris zeicola 26-R-13]|uniref:DUF7730 domain-containing protein n=1 Tax=Cochliobolus carbonum (strain 26-R-13) TaxID=930089 RepID=W6Z199_COCC2|nr:uncharacterized protein COCCADRAFT_1695 [Bipolaris zeicola 26-R-13]EUC37456.1 hypothetical protein COCCADRAFT_1695 [Bipolaris zeicola 26-R-13]